MTEHILLGEQPSGADSVAAASVILLYSVRWMGLTTRVGWSKLSSGAWSLDRASALQIFDPG